MFTEHDFIHDEGCGCCSTWLHAPESRQKYLFSRFQNQLFEKAQVENGAQVLDINMDEGIVCSKVSKIRSADVDATCHNIY